MVLATWWGWDDLPSIALAVALAFFFGYLLTLVPLVRAGTVLGTALGIAFVADTLSITTMEIVDNAVLLLCPGALEAGLGDALFWISLAVALAVAWGPHFSRQPCADRPWPRSCACPLQRDARALAALVRCVAGSGLRSLAPSLAPRGDRGRGDP